MRKISLLSTLGLIAALPLSALASERCAHAATRDAALDLAGVRTVVFDIGPHTLTLAGKAGAPGFMHGKACASDEKLLAELVVNQRRDGDTLVVRAERLGWSQAGSWSGNRYADLYLDTTLPDSIAVQVKVGSGEARIEGVASLAADVGSGELDARHIRGALFADVGSGDILAEDVGALHAVSVGSGDLSARGIRGDAIVGEIHSGDLVIADAGGSVRIDAIGSGDAKVSGVSGDVTVRSIGSGDLDARDVRGDLVVTSVGSGSVDHRGIGGRVRVPADD